MHLAPDCKEPADHVAIELLALAEARCGKTGRRSSRHWRWRCAAGARAFAAALISADGYGFYGNAARFPTALLDKIALARPAAIAQDMAATAARI